MNESRFFKKVLTPAEVGNTGTHEKYIRLTNDFDFESFFQQEGEMNGSVRQILFAAKDLSVGHEEDDPIPFKFVYYENSNKEKRLPSLGALYNSHNIKEGDVIILESKTSDGNTEFFFSHINAGEIILNPSTIYYTEKETVITYTKVPKDVVLQQIYYGAPGTGKSHRIKKQLVEMNVPKGNIFRTTFHPDSDYSSFVGAYKPTMKKQYRYDGKVKAKYYEDDDLAGAKREDAIIDKVIQYDFVPQTFIKAYIQAYKKPDENVYLIIEEINRGNCAQIFGDLFQLLDRDDNGKSQYPIKADSDLRMYLEEELGNHSDGIKDGELCLPSNLYIWATMNTSDQSLFPIDSAFKRRWDWEYVKIADAEKDWKIKCGSKYCDWWEFIKEINKKIAKETSSDDKKLGYFFCKPPKGSDEISEEKFVSKVLFYLWNDVFKDGDISLFKVSEVENAEICFDAFYNNDNTVNVNAIEKFLTSIVGDKHLMSSDDNQMPDEEGYDNENSSDYSKYSFDGKSALPKKELGYNIVLKYVNEHNDKTFAELQSDLTFDNTVDNRYRYNGILARTNNISDGYKRYFSSKELTSSDGVKYKILNGWNKYNIDFIIKFAEAQGWEVSKETE